MFTLKGIYSMDKIRLFYSMAPDRTIAMHHIEGSQKDNTRITIALIANVDGSDDIEPFMFGHAYRPRAFKHKTEEQLGFYYRHNKKA